MERSDEGRKATYSITEPAGPRSGPRGGPRRTCSRTSTSRCASWPTRCASGCTAGGRPARGAARGRQAGAGDRHAGRRHARTSRGPLAAPGGPAFADLDAAVNAFRCDVREAVRACRPTPRRARRSWTSCTTPRGGSATSSTSTDRLAWRGTAAAGREPAPAQTVMTTLPKTSPSTIRANPSRASASGCTESTTGSMPRSATNRASRSSSDRVPMVEPTTRSWRK